MKIVERLETRAEIGLKEAIEELEHDLNSILLWVTRSTKKVRIVKDMCRYTNQDIGWVSLYFDRGRDNHSICIDLPALFKSKDAEFHLFKTEKDAYLWIAKFYSQPETEEE